MAGGEIQSPYCYRFMHTCMPTRRNTCVHMHTLQIQRKAHNLSRFHQSWKKMRVYHTACNAQQILGSVCQTVQSKAQIWQKQQSSACGAFVVKEQLFGVRGLGFVHVRDPVKHIKLLTSLTLTLSCCLSLVSYWQWHIRSVKWFPCLCLVPHLLHIITWKNAVKILTSHSALCAKYTLQVVLTLIGLWETVMVSLSVQLSQIRWSDFHQLCPSCDRLALHSSLLKARFRAEIDAFCLLKPETQKHILNLGQRCSC